MSFSLPLQDPLQILSVLVVLILVVQRLARRIGLPPIVGLILAGVVVGTNGIGLIERAQGIEFFSTTGLLYIMFIAGLEIDLGQVRRRSGRIPRNLTPDRRTGSCGQSSTPGGSFLIWKHKLAVMRCASSCAATWRT